MAVIAQKVSITTIVIVIGDADNMNEKTLKKSDNEAPYNGIHVCSHTCHAYDLANAIDRQNVRMV